MQKIKHNTHTYILCAYLTFSCFIAVLSEFLSKRLGFEYDQSPSSIIFSGYAGFSCMIIAACFILRKSPIALQYLYVGLVGLNALIWGGYAYIFSQITPDISFNAFGLSTIIGFYLCCIFLEKKPEKTQFILMASIIALATASTPTLLNITSLYNEIFDYKIIDLSNTIRVTTKVTDYRTPVFIDFASKIPYAFILQIILLIVATLWYTEKKPLFFHAIIFSIFLGFNIYSITPAIGPAQMIDGLCSCSMLKNAPNFCQFIAPNTQFLNMSFFKNAIPSLHTTWSILIFIHVWSLKTKWRYVFLCLSLLSLMGTITTGNHWVIDWIITAPFALFCAAIPAHFYKKNYPILGFAILCLSLFLIWMAIIRESILIESDFLLQFLSLFSVAIPFLGAYRFRYALIGSNRP